MPTHTSKLSLTLITLLTTSLSLAQSKPHPDLLKGAPKPNDERFMKMHESFLKRTTEGPVDLLFLGDSITAGWATRAKDLFESEYGPHKPANFGIGGDHVYNVLWRIDNGELDHISPKVLVLMIGTNDSGANTGQEIAAGIENLTKKIHAKLPDTKILLLAIFPRGPHTAKNGNADDGTEKMKVINTANDLIAKLDDGGKTIKYLNINHVFVDKDGKIPDDVMNDQLHPTKKGYHLWADAMRPTLTDLLSR